MHERTLLKTSLICSILGLLVLSVLVNEVKINQSTISSLDDKIGKNVVVTGVVQMMRENNGTTFLKITKEEDVDVVLFDSAQGITIGTLVQVRGSVDTYNGGTELLGDEVRVIG